MLHQGADQILSDLAVRRLGVFLGRVVFQVEQLHGLERMILEEFPVALADRIVSSALVAVVSFASHPDQGAVWITLGSLKPNGSEAFPFDLVFDLDMPPSQSHR